MLSSLDQVGAAVGIVGVADEADEVVNVAASATVLEAAQAVVVTNATTLATTVARQSNAQASVAALGAQSAYPLRWLLTSNLCSAKTRKTR